MDKIEKEIINLFKTPIPFNVRVLQNTLPIPFFGNYRGASAATISLNPSDKEFLDKKGNWLLGSKKRFESLESLKCSNACELTDDMIKASFQSCTEYFARNTAYWQWFRPIENIIKNATDGKVSYTNGEMAHFDLSPWATNPVWSGLHLEEQQVLKSEGIIFLKWIIENSNPKIFFLNGKTTCETIVSEIFNEKVLWIKESPTDKWSFYLRRIQLHNKEICLVGWNLYLQQSGPSEVLIKKLKDVVNNETNFLNSF